MRHQLVQKFQLMNKLILFCTVFNLVVILYYWETAAATSILQDHLFGQVRNGKKKDIGSSLLVFTVSQHRAFLF